MRSLIAAATLSLVACATMEPPRAHTAGSGMFDTARMAQVETEARWRGVKVIWVNPPRKP